MLALLTYALPITVLIPVHGVVQLGSNSSRAFLQRKHIDWPIAWLFMAGAMVAAVMGVFIVVQVPESALKIVLGLFILAMVWIKLPKLKKMPPPLLVAGGAFTTFVSFFAGATGPLVAVFLSGLFNEHRKLVATHAITMVMQHGFKLAVFIFAGFAFAEWLPFAGAMIISGYFGAKAGTYYMNTTPESILKILFKGVLTLCALDLLRRGLV